MRSSFEGVPSNPVIFNNSGNHIGPNNAGTIDDPQNLWASVQNTLGWSMGTIFVDGDFGQHANERTVSEEVAKNDAARLVDKANGTYADHRGLASLGLFLGVFDPITGTIDDERLKAEFHGGKSVLDVGAGLGILSQDLRDNTDAFVVDVDFSTEVLQGANDRASRAQVCSDGLTLPFADNTFDRTIAMLSTNLHTPTLEGHLGALMEKLRVTNVGGRVLSTPVFPAIVVRSNEWVGIDRIEASSMPISDEDRRGLQSRRDFLRSEATRNLAMFLLLDKLIVEKVIDFTPKLFIEPDNSPGSFGDRDVISGVIDKKKHLDPDAIRTLIESSTSFVRR